jgi:hypothetical protein
MLMGDTTLEENARMESMDDDAKKDGGCHNGGKGRALLTASVFWGGADFDLERIIFSSFTTARLQVD